MRARIATVGIFSAGLLLIPSIVGADDKPPIESNSGEHTQIQGPQVKKVQEEKLLSGVSISEAVKEEILFDPALPSDIRVRTDNGIVTLSGNVATILAKEQAAQIAKTVKGVRSVVDRLLVVPPLNRSDNEIKRDVLRALSEDPATDAYEVLVEVDDGKVALKGTVSSWQEKQLSATVAKGVKGVRDLTNAIKVEYEAERSDDEIAPDIKQGLRWNRLVDHALIEVAIKDGRVRLSGVVGSAAEKEEAVTTAWVAGVNAVDASELEVKRWARDPDLRREKYVNNSDADIERAIVDAFLYDPRVAAFEIRPEVRFGVVTLRGEVDNLMAKRAAETDARHTVGVLRVDNRIRISSGVDFSDDAVKERIASAFNRNPFVDRYEIDVEVQDGIATLSGGVESAFEKFEADDVAARVEGVLEVQNQIEIQEEKGRLLVYDPYVLPWHPPSYRWYVPTTVTTIKKDWEIKQDIERQLFWSPFVDSDEVNVKVFEGKATLTGDVDSWIEKNAATENALEGGAVEVINKLDVS